VAGWGSGPHSYSLCSSPCQCWGLCEDLATLRPLPGHHPDRQPGLQSAVMAAGGPEPSRLPRKPLSPVLLPDSFSLPPNAGLACWVGCGVWAWWNGKAENEHRVRLSACVLLATQKLPVPSLGLGPRPCGTSSFWEALPPLELFLPLPLCSSCHNPRTDANRPIR
jgi:hypothetical protein